MYDVSKKFLYIKVFILAFFMHLYMQLYILCICLIVYFYILKRIKRHFRTFFYMITYHSSNDVKLLRVL